jgi:hypothetical protein
MGKKDESIAKPLSLHQTPSKGAPLSIQSTSQFLPYQDGNPQFELQSVGARLGAILMVQRETVRNVTPESNANFLIRLLGDQWPAIERETAALANLSNALFFAITGPKSCGSIAVSRAVPARCCGGEPKL